MQITKILKTTALMAAVLGLTIGCAAQQEEPAKPEVTKGPSAAEKAIAAAEAARKKAKSVGGEWRDIGKIIKKAKAALKAGDDKKAIKLANKARRQGEMGYTQALKERPSHGEQYGKGASGGDYTVVRGDSLWTISAKGDVYGDPYQWPLIYKANRDQIKDADLIYPGQNFAIESASAADVDAAIRHAKTRGAWAIGVTEESDKAYLAR